MPDYNHQRVFFKNTDKLDETDLEMAQSSATQCAMSKKVMPQYVFLLIAEDTEQRDDTQEAIKTILNNYLTKAFATASTVKLKGKKSFYVDAFSFSSELTQEEILKQIADHSVPEELLTLLVLSENFTGQNYLYTAI